MSQELAFALIAAAVVMAPLKARLHQAKPEGSQRCRGLDLRAIALAAAAAACCDTRGATAPGAPSRDLCFATVAERSGIPERLLRAVARVESDFQANAVHLNANGTRDVGVMQINSSHFADLQARYNITEAMLLERPCINITVGARILGDFLRTYQGTWRGVGSYGAGAASTREDARRAYASRVAHALTERWPAKRIDGAARVQRRMVDLP